MKQIWELHFCEGSYFMAKIKGQESGIIDNTFTVYIGDIETTSEGIMKIINNLSKLNVELK